jgi:hypothetical protein
MFTCEEAVITDMCFISCILWTNLPQLLVIFCRSKGNVTNVSIEMKGVLIDRFQCMVIKSNISAKSEQPLSSENPKTPRRCFFWSLNGIK